MNKKLFVPLAIIVIGLLVAGVIAYTNFSKSPDQVEEENISLEEAGEKVITFINDKAVYISSGIIVLVFLSELTIKTFSKISVIFSWIKLLISG